MIKRNLFGALFLFVLSATFVNGQSITEGVESPDGTGTKEAQGNSEVNENKKTAKNISYFEAARSRYEKKEQQKVMINNGDKSEADKVKTSYRK
ncbi:hypothetical protein [Marinigracilibium pacificum]|uniref:Uncharacterized protein n=1 Tax=Marinigracilibium pacificum TaxID=2729599 RepID=A0A848IY32_9BACT|nr:hypothetical protein [Marinigracilibium pacificum]NMM48078.1 hypothetical protein [Marinigracilibium pacificum]